MTRVARSAAEGWDVRDLAMTAHYCPLSDQLLSVDVHRRDEEPVEELLLGL
jgi:N-methylhydantoinase B